MWETKWLTMNRKLREIQTICPMWMRHSHVYLPARQPTPISTLPKQTVHTYTHSPGLEQFPLLSLQPSRQIAKTRRKKKSQYTALNAVPLSLQHWYLHIHPPIMKLTVARRPWHHIPTTRPYRAPVLLKQPTGSLYVEVHKASICLKFGASIWSKPVRHAPSCHEGNRWRVCLSRFKCTGPTWHWFAGQHIRRLTVSGRFSPEQMLALNSRQLSLLLFVVCHNHICSCYCRAPNNGRGLNIDGAWRIIMPRLTLARAVGRAPPINGRAAPHRLRIKLPATRCTVLHEYTRIVLPTSCAQARF